MSEANIVIILSLITINVAHIIFLFNILTQDGSDPLPDDFIFPDGFGKGPEVINQLPKGSRIYILKDN